MVLDFWLLVNHLFTEAPPLYVYDNLLKFKSTNILYLIGTLYFYKITLLPQIKTAICMYVIL